MNNFENPKDIIDRETIADAEKIAPIENAKTIEEQLESVVLAVKDFKEKQQDLEKKIDKIISKIDDNMSGEEIERNYDLKKLVLDLENLTILMEKKIKELGAYDENFNSLRAINNLERKN